METAELLVGTRAEWVSDRLSPQDCKPRHIGRVTSFSYFLDDDPNNYESIDVMGILEGVAGKIVQVSGVEYDYDNIKNLKSWRVKIA